MADLLAGRLRESDTVARLGGDEFVVVLEDLAEREEAGRLAGELIARLGQPFTLADGQVVHIGASIGVSLYPDHGDGAGALLAQADAALYRAKQAGRNCWQPAGDGDPAA